MTELTQLKARWLILHNDTFCSLEIAERFIATIASQKLSTEIEQPGDFEYAYDEFIKLAREAAEKIAAVRPASKKPTMSQSSIVANCPTCGALPFEIEKWLITINAHCTVIAEPGPWDDAKVLAACIKINVDDELRPAIIAALKAANEIATVRPSASAKVDDEIVERVARAIFFEQRNIMHDHDENWKKAHQNVWKDSARAALAALTVMER